MRKSSHPKILESATRNQPENPVLQHSVNSPAGGDSVFSSAWSNDVSQVNPERDKISHFGENEFISQNLNFYRKKYEHDFKFWEPDSTNQVVSNIIDDGDPLYQQYLQRVIAESSVVARKMHGPDRQTFLAGAREQRNEAGFQAYLQRYSNLHSPSSQNPKLFSSGSDHELKSTLDIAPHSEDLREQHPVWTSATNLTAPIFKFEEAGNMEINCFHVNRLQSTFPTFSPEFKFGANSPSPGFQFGVAGSTSYVAEGTIFKFPAVAESNTDIDTRRGVRAFGAIPSTDTCSPHSSDPTTRVIHTPLPIFYSEEDDRLAVILATNRLSIRDAARRANVWRAHLVGAGDDEQEYCKTFRVSLDKLFHSHIGASGEIGLVEQILKLLRIKHISPIGLSQQYATQESAPNKIYYVEGGWHSCFRFSVEATEPQFQQEFLSIEIRVCPAALLEHVRLTHTPLIFSEVFSPEEKYLLSFLRGLAGDTGEASHAGWLGYFSLSQTDRIENFFEAVGEPVPWDSLLNPLWGELLQCVEDSWLQCDSFLRSAHTEYPSLGLPTVLPPSVPNAQPRVPNIEVRSFRSHTWTDAESPREEPVTYVGDTPTLEGGSQSTGALKSVRVRSPANNRLLSAARQKGPDIRTPRRSSPLDALFLRRSTRLASGAHALHAACNLFCYFVSTVLLTRLLLWVGPGSSRVPFYLVGDIVAY